MMPFTSSSTRSLSTILSWRDSLASYKTQSEFQALLNKLHLERKSGVAIWPAQKHVFYALKLTPLHTVKVVIIGQDPYHGPNQAHGLAFSVPKGIRVPPSLRNIYTAIQKDYPNSILPQHGCLEGWALQGVLLLNTVLTVQEGLPASHHNWGWQHFTHYVLTILNEAKASLVFLLWGQHAQNLRHLLDPDRHLILCTSHPSPLSVHRGFLTAGHFKKTNAYLISKGIQPIDWSGL